jgi:hypothetical protein
MKHETYEEMTDEPKEKISEGSAFYEWEDMMKDDDYEYWWELSHDQKKLMKEFYDHCSGYDDLKHIKEG